MKLLSPVIEAHAFEGRDFVGGHPVLDFINTVTGRDQMPRDWLVDYPAYVAWLKASTALPGRDLKRLAVLAEAEPAAAERALKSAKHLREALFGIFSSLARQAPVNPAEVEILERSWKRAMSGQRLTATKTGVEVSDAPEMVDLHRPTHGIALGAVRLLEALPGDRLRICAGSNCAWLFIDSSKTGRRKWCDMATCGNVAKARRHYQASRRGPARPVPGRDSSA